MSTAGDRRSERLASDATSTPEIISRLHGERLAAPNAPSSNIPFPALLPKGRAASDGRGPSDAMETVAHSDRLFAWPHFHASVRARRWLITSGFVLLAGVMTGIWFVGQNWPFRYRLIHPLLEDVFGSQVIIRHYHRVYFPHPGFIATDLTIRRKSAPGAAADRHRQHIFCPGPLVRPVPSPRPCANG